jgi:hypothetical protein
VTNLRSVESAGFEVARFLLVATLIQSNLTISEDRIGRMGQVHVRAFSPVTTNLHSSFMRLVTIAEAFTESVNAALFETRRPEASDVFSFLVEDHLLAILSWPQRQESFRRYHFLSLGECPVWSRLDVGIEVRNSLAHGLGALTRRQQRDGKVAAKLKSARIAIEEGHLLLGPEHVRDCFDYCLAYVSWLDGQARGRLAFAKFTG